MAKYDIVIKDGMIVDGTGAPRFRGDVGVSDGRITQIGNIDADQGDRVINAEGCIVAPGFIDTHTHYDAQIFWDPYCSLSGWHGVTSVVIGNCGFGFAPIAPEQRERAMLSMTRVEAIPLASMQRGMPWDWVTFPEFMDSLDRTPKAVNVLSYVPLGPLLVWVLGWEDAKAGREPTPDEMEQLRKLLAEALDAGGCGWSAQRLPPWGGMASQRDFDGTPMPTDCMSDATALEFAKVLGGRNEGFMMMTYVTGDNDKDRAHFEELARVSGRPLLYNAVQVSPDHPNRHRRQLAWLEKCREEGLRVLCQAVTVGTGVTFSFEDWNLFDDADAWTEATTGTLEEKKAKLADPARRPALLEESAQVERGNIVNSFREITVLKPISPEMQQYKDKFIGQIADERGCHPVEALLDIAVADGLETIFYYEPPTDVELTRELVTNPYVIYGVSDGGAHTKFFTGGRFPTETLIEYVRNLGMIDLEEAHWRLSGLPAFLAGIEDRGKLRLGAAADIVVYDFENLAIGEMEVVHDLPGDEWRRVQRASGYKNVIVNGVITIEDDTEVGTSPGQLLRNGRTAELNTAT